MIDRNRNLNRNRNTEISVGSEPIPKPKDRPYRNRNRNFKNSLFVKGGTVVLGLPFNSWLDMVLANNSEIKLKPYTTYFKEMFDEKLRMRDSYTNPYESKRIE